MLKMKLTYRKATNTEVDYQKCNVLLHNSMQCDRKVAKACSSDVLPENLCNVPSARAGEYQFYLCAGHFNSYLGSVQAGEGVTIIDEDNS